MEKNVKDEPVERDRRPVRVLTAVWGEWHLSRFLDVCVPSILADQNLPVFLQHFPDTVFEICTKRSDIHRINADRSIADLRTLVDVRVRELPDQKIHDPINAQGKLWEEAIARARDAGSLLILNPPDVLWSEGTWAWFADQFSKGKRALFISFLRTVDETFLEELAQDGVLAEGGVKNRVVNVSGRKLTEYMFRHLHPLQSCYLAGGDHLPHHAELIVWPVAKEGLAVRLMAAAPIGIDPAHLNISHALSVSDRLTLQDIAIASDSDVAASASLTPLLKDRHWYFQPRQSEAEEVASWWTRWWSPIGDLLSRQTFRHHVGEMNEAAWRAVEQQADHFVNRASILRDGMLTIRAIDGYDQRWAARGIATALFRDRLHRRISIRGNAIVFCPIDSALQAQSGSALTELLEPSHQGDLAALILRHLADGELPMNGLQDRQTTVHFIGKEGNSIVLEHDDNGLTVNGIRVVTTHALSDRHTLCLIDGVL